MILYSTIVYCIITIVASGESDFEARMQNLTFITGNAQQSQTVMIHILEDSYLETNEQFNCVLTLAGTHDPSVQVRPTLATVTIIDNDSEYERN
jgi:hypothetical protein